MAAALHMEKFSSYEESCFDQSQKRDVCWIPTRGKFVEFRFASGFEYLSLENEFKIADVIPARYKRNCFLEMIPPISSTYVDQLCSRISQNFWRYFRHDRQRWNNASKVWRLPEITSSIILNRRDNAAWCYLFLIASRHSRSHSFSLFEFFFFFFSFLLGAYSLSTNAQTIIYNP